MALGGGAACTIRRVRLKQKEVEQVAHTESLCRPIGRTHSAATYEGDGFEDTGGGNELVNVFLPVVVRRKSIEFEDRR